MIMAPTFNIAVVFLVTLQLAHQVSLSNNFYDTKDLSDPLNNELTFHSRFNVLSSLKSQQSVKRQPHANSNVELHHLNVERESVSRSRSKRELDEAEKDAEVFSKDPKMLSYGKSMPMTTTGDEAGELQHENPESGSWSEEVDTTNKNSLGGLEGKPREEDETSNGEQDAENSQSKAKASTFHSQFQDISSADVDLTPKMTGEDNLSARSAQAPQSNSSEIHIAPTLHYDAPVSKESNIELHESKSTSLTTDTEMHDDGTIENNNTDKQDEDIIISEEHSTRKSDTVAVAESNLEPHKNSKDEYRDDAANTEGEPQNNEMETDKIVKTHEEMHSSEATASDEGMLSNEKDVKQHNREPEEILSKELDIDDNEGEFGKQLDNEDFDVVMDIPVDDLSSKTSGQLKLQDDSNDYSEEGSGDMESDPTGSHETSNVHENVVTNSTDNTPSAEISSATDNNMHLIIDSDTDKTKEENENTTEDEAEDEKEISPIPDPTEIASEVDDPSETNVLSEIDEDEENHEEEPTPDPTENSSIKNDPSLTYDRKSIINPFNIDNGSEIARNIGKQLGIVDSNEDNDEGEESEGSGDPILFPDTELEKSSLENGAMFKIDDPSILDGDTQTEDYIDSTTNKSDMLNINEVIEKPVHHDDLMNAPVIPANEDDIPHVTQDSANVNETGVAGEDITHSPIEDNAPPEHEHRVIIDPSSGVENASDFPSPSGINELGIHIGEKAASPEKIEEETPSSSTGSFIVLGAIMATIVALLGYSVIKSYKQKHETSRRPPEDDIGTELKEIDTLLSPTGRNGHGPPNRSNVESDKLLSPSGENDKNDVNPDGRYPIYQNGFHGEDGVSDKPTNVLQIEDPNDLSEVKVNSHNPDSSKTLIPQVANGLNSSPGNSDSNNKLGEPKSPSANDRGSWGYGTKPETAKIKMFIDHDSIPKTPIVIVKRGPATVEM